MPRNPDNTYTLVPNKDILPNTLQSSTDNTGDLVGIRPRFDDIKNTLSNTIPTSNSNNNTGNVNINADIDMNQNAVYNLSRVNSATSAINTIDTTYAVSVISSDTIDSNAYFYSLSGSSLYISQGKNPSVDNLYLTVNNLFDGRIITLTSEIPIGNVYINNQATNYQVYDNTTVSFLITSVSDNTFNFEIINTALINNYYSIPSASSSDTIYQQPFNISLGQLKFLPILTYLSAVSDNVITFTYSNVWGNYQAMFADNMLLSFTNNATPAVSYYYRIDRIDRTVSKSNNNVVLQLDTNFDDSLKVATQKGYIIGFSFTFNPTNLLKFELITNINNNNPDNNFPNMKASLINSANNTSRVPNCSLLTNINYAASNKQIFIPGVFIPINIDTNIANPLRHLEINYVTTNLPDNTIIGKINTDIGAFAIACGSVDATADRLEIYFTEDGYIVPGNNQVNVYPSQTDLGNFAKRTIPLNASNAFINVIYTKKQ